jgi:phosphatidate cytidylyltransferase
MLSTRILTAVLLIAAVLAALFLLPPRAWAAVTLILIAFAAHEWANLTRMPRAIGIAFAAATLALGLAVWFGAADGGEWRRTVLAICGVATAFWVLIVPPWLNFRWRLHSTMVAALVGWVVLLAAWIAIAALQAQSPARLLAAMAIVWIADTAAYFAGRAFGKHKLAPEISPGKTWEGVAGGVLAVMIYAIVLAITAPAVAGVASPTGRVVFVLFAMAIAALSVCGDLFESLQKRQTGLKDSGSILPGHGGILDRIDALLAAMPPLAIAAVVLAA